jgi:hypothetical protein
MTRHRTLFGLLLPALFACAPDDSGPTPEQLEERRMAARQACIAQRLALRAEDELQTLQQMMVASGPLGFQQAYAQHADLRLSAYAQLDSALNHARSPEDSLRHMERAAAYEIRRPEPGSVEENVIVSYERNLAAVLGDADHPCNWASDLERED